MTKEVNEAMHRAIKVRPRIMWIPPKTLERFVKKKKLMKKPYLKKREGRT